MLFILLRRTLWHRSLILRRLSIPPPSLWLTVAIRSSPLHLPPPDRSSCPVHPSTFPSLPRQPTPFPTPVRRSRPTEPHRLPPSKSTFHIYIYINESTFASLLFTSETPFSPPVFIYIHIIIAYVSCLFDWLFLSSLLLNLLYCILPLSHLFDLSSGCVDEFRGAVERNEM